MNKAGLMHAMNMNDVYALNKGTLLFKLATAKEDIKSVTLYYVDKFQRDYNLEDLKQQKMLKIGSTYEQDYFEAIVTVDAITLKYYFDVIDFEGNRCFYCENGVYEGVPKELPEMFDVPLQAREEEIFKIPKWMEEGIVYQIFPDRFFKGVAREDDKSYDLWNGEVKWDSLLGGSIRGIIEKLDYIEELGVTILYLNPIFKSPSNHKYDTTDYFEIDPHFGTKADFKELVEKAHLRNFKVVIDGVFNHCGYDFFAFQDVIKKEEDSRYKDWFHIYKFPIDTGYRPDKMNEKPSYDTFGYHGAMPKLNMKNQEVRQYIFDLTEYWTKEFNIDGWRLDACDEISFDFWRAFRKHIKGINEDLSIIGEIWFDATTWLQGDQYDSVMNYKFRSPVVNFIALGKLKATGFDNQIQYTRVRYKKPIQLGLWNLIGSHDTARFLTLCNKDSRKLKLAMLLQFTLQGNPVIYYGDEVGMDGEHDPGCRKGMFWDKRLQNQDILDYVKQLIQLRKSNKVLIQGEYKAIIADDYENLLIYKRFNNHQEMYILVNNNEQNIDLTKYNLVWSDIQHQTKLINIVNNEAFSGVLEPFSGVILTNQ